MMLKSKFNKLLEHMHIMKSSKWEGGHWDDWLVKSEFRIIYLLCISFLLPGPVDYAEHVIWRIMQDETINIISIWYFGACQGANSQLWVMRCLP